MGLCGLQGSLRVSMGGLCGSPQSLWEVSMGLCGLCGRSLWSLLVSRRYLDLTEIIQFCLKIYDLLRHPHLWVGEWLGKWVGSGQMTNLIKLELFDII